MKKILITLLFLISFSFCEFQLHEAKISITLAEDGSAVVEEKITLLVFGNYSAHVYESGFNENTLSKWQELTNISEIKTHISEGNSNIKNKIVKPQPLKRSLSNTALSYGQIILSYTAEPYYDSNGKKINNTGLVTMEQYKPRLTRYYVNKEAFNFQRTEGEDVKLGEKITLSITPPKKAMITQLNPLSSEFENVTFPTPSKTVNWKGIPLIQFIFIYEIEQSLDKEVTLFFSDFQEAIRTNLVSPEGTAALFIAIILIISYFYLRLSKK